MSGVVTQDIPADDIQEITTEIAAIYGVNKNDITTTVDYVTSGTLDVVIPAGLSDAEAAAAIQESLSEVLGIHSKDVLVTVEDGIVSYQVTGSSYAEAEAVLNKMKEAGFVSDLESELSSSGITVSNITSDNQIEAVISATIDTTDATATVDPVESIQNLTKEYGLTTSVVKSMQFFFSIFCVRYVHHVCAYICTEHSPD